MEELFKKIEIPKIVIVILLCIIAAMYAAQAYHFFWSGKLNRIKFIEEEENGPIAD